LGCYHQAATNTPQIRMPIVYALLAYFPICPPSHHERRKAGCHSRSGVHEMLHRNCHPAEQGDSLVPAKVSFALSVMPYPFSGLCRTVSLIALILPYFFSKISLQIGHFILSNRNFVFHSLIFRVAHNFLSLMPFKFYMFPRLSTIDFLYMGNRLAILPVFNM